MAESFGSFTFDPGTLFLNLGLVEERVRQSMVAASFLVRGQAVEYMKQNAPWTDRTGNARAGLNGQVVIEDADNVAVVLYQSVFYGIFLETRFAGQYAIVMPTVQKFGPTLMDTVSKLAFGGFKA